MRDNGSLRGRLLGNLALLLVVLMLASGLSAYWNGREAADTAYDRTLLAFGENHRRGPVAARWFVERGCALRGAGHVCL